ncbi:MAG: GGDEF domain-containing protein [Bacteroidales bacterium]|nr:GGDEF domain-containing protein [Clostridium sp.]MCM1202822.1 GGDEF domain-containing protein [Bacteroidales bacterium]
MENRHVKYDRIYVLMFLFSAFVVIFPICRYKGPSLADDFFGKGWDYETGWHTAEGEPVVLDKLNQVDGTKAGEEYSIYNTVPDTIEEGDALCFRSKNIFFQVYIDGKLQYNPYVPESPIYTKAYGTKWNYVRIPTAASGKQIEVRLTYVYEDARACMDNIYIGQPAGAILNTFGEKMIAFVTCILLLFVGLLLLIADIPINMREQKNHELRYLGLFALSIVIWCASETNLMQFYLGDNRIMQVVSCTALMLIPIPTVLYLDTAFGFRHKFVVPLICIPSTILFVLCWTLHFLGVADIHQTLSLNHLMLAFTAIILLYTIVRNTIVTSKNQSRNVYRVLRTIGLSAISVATVADIIRYYHGNGTDSAMFVRIGLLLFILCFGSSSLEKTINAVKLGVQSEFVAQLAYSDGLTRIGNRTSFEEHLVDLEKVKDDLPAVGIVMFDVNDLKYVNDHMGHHQGDAMLVKSADIIRAAFGDECSDCFRIGGDEFAVLISGDDVPGCYEEGIIRFSEAIKQYNELPDKKFRISIAYGFAVYDKESRGTKLMDIYQQADKQMYENKKKMKANQIPPEEYYRTEHA